MTFYRRPITWIVLGLLAWGAILALGAYVNNDDRYNPSRPLIIATFMGAFLAFWLILLNTRRGRELAERAKGRQGTGRPNE